MQLRDHYMEIRAAGGEVLTVAPLDGLPLARFVDEMKLPFPVLADPQRRVYRAYGLERGLSVRPVGVIKYLRLLWQEGHFYPPRSDPMQTGGDFVIDRAGVIQFAYTSPDPMNRIGIHTLTRTLSGMRA